ncbi:MAG: HAD family phosphatase [Candidatus Altiarchaeota archaeon]
MIKTLIFDLGGVLFSNGTGAAVKLISEGYSIDEDKVSSVLRGELGNSYRRGELNFDEFWEKAKSAWNCDADPDELARIWDGCFVINDSVSDIIGRLNREGYELLYLSNNRVGTVSFLEGRYDFLRMFKDGVFSFDVGFIKPDPRIYRALLEKTSSRPEECVFIDDKAENLKPAEKLGMRTIHFGEDTDITDELNRLGVGL